MRNCELMKTTRRKKYKGRKYWEVSCKLVYVYSRKVKNDRNGNFFFLSLILKSVSVDCGFLLLLRVNIEVI